MINIENNALDSYLKFVQESFNTGGSAEADFYKIMNNLDIISRDLQETIKNREQARFLKNQLQGLTLLRDQGKYSKFEKLGNMGFKNAGLKQIYSANEELIHDTKSGRIWIESYKKYMKSLEHRKKKVSLHSQLIKLGKSILGRAIELCPYKTGNLRKSGIMMDFGTYIIIAFTADYATYVHEDMNLKHTIGRAKFLELAMQEFFPSKRVWVEHVGSNKVMCKISMNPLFVDYTHYGR